MLVEQRRQAARNRYNYCITEILGESQPDDSDAHKGLQTGQDPDFPDIRGVREEQTVPTAMSCRVDGSTSTPRLG